MAVLDALGALAARAGAEVVSLRTLLAARRATTNSLTRGELTALALADRLVPGCLYRVAGEDRLVLARSTRLFTEV